ncbi:ABC transporter substrate-binding protein [Pandoraea pneumonica]|uniref:ABC transporter substrate-binding protein n=1 Tax=Pandoraea pneumonica TaxID=2508299 RepID=A0A5E4TP25_9BURK|nr:ABC transporter substrate-binding protein [Pandoraea pneumonica]VVD89575.1 ABC transporter substrate-binding protein [Pandoraea pneumonica]
MTQSEARRVRDVLGRLILVLALMALGFVALSLSGPARAAPAQPLEKPKITIAVGGKPGLYYLPLTIAEQLGYFKDEGLDVTIDDFAGGSKALQAVVGGSADIGTGAFEHTLLMQTKGLTYQSFVVLGAAPQLVLGVVKSHSNDVKAVKDLKGMRIGVSAPGSSTHMLVNVALAKAGLKPSDVSIVGVGTNATVVAAARGGQVDAVSNVDPMMTLLQESGDIKVLIDTRTQAGTRAMFGGPMPAAVMYAPQSFIQKNPRTVQALANAIVRADKWLQHASAAELLKTVPEPYLLGDKTLYLKAFANCREAFSPDGMMPADGPATALRALASFTPEVKPAQIRLGDTWTNTFATQANRQYP